MSPRLPDTVDPWRLADREKRFEGRIALGELHRLGQMLETTEGEVSYTLEFARDARKRACVTGNLRASLRLVCQRCLESLDYPVDLQVRLAAVESPEEAELLPENLEPLLVGEPGVKLAEIIEDELILALPQVPVHDSATCRLLVGTSADEHRATDDQRDRTVPDNPFAALLQLKRKGSDQ